MKTILLIGDSIRIGYQEYVKEALKDKGKVVYPEENGRFSKYTLWAINIEEVSKLIVASEKEIRILNRY